MTPEEERIAAHHQKLGNAMIPVRISKLLVERTNGLPQRRDNVVPFKNK